MALDGSEEFGAFLDHWGQIDAVEAMSWLSSARPVTDRAERNTPRSRVLMGWASVDPEAARAWVEAHPELAAANDTWYGIIQGICQTDLDAATRLALEKQPKNLASALGVIAQQASRRGLLDGLQQWFESLPEQAEGSTSPRSIASHYVSMAIQRRGDEAAAEWLTTQADKPWRVDDDISRVARTWSEKNPPAAAQWLASLPAGPNPATPYPGLANCVEAWLKRNPDEVAIWLEQNRNVSFYDSAAAGVARYYDRQGDPTAAQQWASSIKSEVIRKKAILPSGLGSAHPDAQ
jgi:hypothetical protein